MARLTDTAAHIESVRRVHDDHQILNQTVARAEAAIRARWTELGGAARLGEPVSSVRNRMWTFADGGSLVYSPTADRAFHVYGLIHAKWMALGGLAFGIPENDETGTPDGIGRYNHFSGGKSIYWTPGTGAQAVWGRIRDRWAALGWERSYLGYPTSDETEFPEGGRASDFQHGGVYWWPDTDAIDLRDVVIHYTGLYAFGETDWDQGSDSDEPYAIIGVSSPHGARTVTTRIYDDVDGQEARPDLLEVYRGRPFGVAIGCVLMEHDEGDPNRYRDEIGSAVALAHQAGTAALGVVPFVGPALAAAAGPLLGKFVPDVADAISDLLDLGDDTIGSSTQIISARQLVLLAARTGNSTFNGIGFKVESPLISGSGASYKIYFGVVPA